MFARNRSGTRYGEAEGRDAYHGDGRGAQIDGESKPPGRGNDAQREGEGRHQ